MNARQERNRAGEADYIRQEAATLNERAKRLGLALRVVVVYENPPREAVARAICTACEERPDGIGDARGNSFRWQDYLPAADAAIYAATGVK